MRHSSVYANMPSAGKLTCRALAYVSAMEYFAQHTSELKSGWFGKVKVDTKWTSALAAPKAFSGTPQFKVSKGVVVEDQTMVSFGVYDVH
jgi:hypothetical protein